MGNVYRKEKRLYGKNVHDTHQLHWFSKAYAEPDTI